MIKMNKKKGFTLIELLATILILSIVISLVVFISINSIKKAKNKSYQTTINNIEKIASNYMLENSDRLFYIPINDSDFEYQCITIKNLIDLGYFDEEITKSKVDEAEIVSINDYVYLLRNSKTKNIEKSMYIHNKDKENNEKCQKATTATGAIKLISHPSLDEWSQEKEITIVYSLNNLNDLTTLSKYKYNYSYDGNYEEIENKETTKVVIVRSKGTLEAQITKENELESIADVSQKIIKIDREGPQISLLNNDEKYVSKKTSITLSINDNESGVDITSIAKEDFNIFIGEKQIDESNYTLDRNENNYKITIKNNTESGNITIKINQNQIYDNAGNGNDEMSFLSKITFDNSPPTCTLDIKNNQVILSTKDNLKLNLYGLSKTEINSTNKIEKLDVSIGTFNGYVQDVAGNTGTCKLSVKSTVISNYQITKKTCNYKVSSYDCWAPSTVYYKATTKTCQQIPDGYYITSHTCKATEYQKTTQTCVKGFLKPKFQSNTSTTSSCVTTSAFTCNKNNINKSYTSNCEKIKFGFTETTTNGISCTNTTNTGCNALHEGGIYISCESKYKYQFGTSSTKDGLLSCTNNIIACNETNYVNNNRTYRSCTDYLECTIGGTLGSDNVCHKNKQSYCSAAAGWQVEKTNYSSKFDTDTYNYNTCSVEKEISCSSTSNDGKSYISSCEPLEYACDNSEYQKLNEKYCYKIG